ncbi:MAG: helix-turn-helix transcriptional regulator [Candidatus Zixiibacteriota bacterium]
MDVAGRLKAARIQAGLSQGQVAKLLNFQRPTISEIEAGRRKVSSEELVHFAEIYDVSISWLAAGNAVVESPNVELAARELSKLKQEDLDRVLKLLQSIRETRKSSQ